MHPKDGTANSVDPDQTAFQEQSGAVWSASTLFAQNCLSRNLGSLSWYTVQWAMSWENLFMSYVNNKGADQPGHLRSLISAFVVRCLDSIIPVPAKSKLSRLQLASVAEQAGLSLTWSETPKTGFLVAWLKCNTTTTYSLVTWNGNEDSCSSNTTLPQLTVWWLGMRMKTVVAQMQHYHNLQFGDLEWEWRQL